MNDDMREDIKQLQEVLVNIANMCHENKQLLSELQEDHAKLKESLKRGD